MKRDSLKKRLSIESLTVQIGRVEAPFLLVLASMEKVWVGVMIVRKACKMFGDHAHF